MYKKMVVLLDGSDLAEVVFDYAQELSGRLGVDLELLHVASPHEADQLAMRRGYIEHMAEVVCAGAEEIRQSAGALDQCILARGTVRVGDPAEEIVKYLEEEDVDLIMMSTHGRSGFRGFNIGGVANKVIHAAQVPVWLVPTELREEIVADTLQKRTIVIPLSGSKSAEGAIRHALTVVGQRGAESEFILLHVQEGPSTVYPPGQLEERAAERVRMQTYLEGVAQPLRDAGYETRVEIVVGDPAPAIIDYLIDSPPQLVAMATRGHTGLGRMVFGSVTENVIHLIKKTPMLLVPGNE